MTNAELANRIANAPAMVCKAMAKEFERMATNPISEQIVGHDAPKLAAARATYTELLEQFHKAYNDADLQHGSLCCWCPVDGEVYGGKCSCGKDKVEALSNRISAMKGS